MRHFRQYLSKRGPAMAAVLAVVVGTIGLSAGPASAVPVTLDTARACAPTDASNQPAQTVDLSLSAGLADGNYVARTTYGGKTYASELFTVTGGAAPAGVTVMPTTAFGVTDPSSDLGSGSLPRTAFSFPHVQLYSYGGAPDLHADPGTLAFTFDDVAVAAVTCLDAPTVVVSKGSYSADASTFTVWISKATGLLPSGQFTVRAYAGSGDGEYEGTLTATATGTFSGTLALPVTTPKSNTSTPPFRVVGQSAAGTPDAKFQSFGPLTVNATAPAQVTVTDASAARPQCGTGFAVTSTISAADSTHAYQWRATVAPAGAVTSATFKPTSDPYTATQTVSSSTSTLPIASTPVTLELWDTTPSTDVKVSTATVTLPACSGVSGTVTAGGSLSSDPKDTKPSSSNPVVATVTSPVAGDVAITKGTTSGAVAGWTAMGVHVDITAPKSTAAKPLKLTFAVYAPAMPSGRYVSDLGVFRNGSLLPDCVGSTAASPDPCVSSMSYSGTTVTFTVLTSQASAWDVMAAKSSRLAGADRYGTAVEISKAQFADVSATAVVLATGTDYPDALVAAPLAKAKNAPLLLNSGPLLRPEVANELQRVAPASATVYVIGGTTAIPNSVVSHLRTLGYSVTRVSGSDRFATASAVAGLLGTPTTVLLATGTDFPDALAAGVAAAKTNATVLLTNGSKLPAATSGYLASATKVYAVGGPAAAAAPASAIDLVGSSRFETALAVAGQFFPNPTSVGVATGLDFPDALSGGALLARAGQPLVLTGTTGPNPTVSNYLTGVKNTVTSAHLFGGSTVITTTAANTIATALGLR